MRTALIASLLALPLLVGCAAEPASDADESTAASSKGEAISNVSGHDLGFEFVRPRSSATFSAVVKSTRPDAELDVVGTGIALSPLMGRVTARSKPGRREDLAGVDVPTNLIEGATLRLAIFDITDPQAKATIVGNGQGLNLFEHLTVDRDEQGYPVSSMTYHTIRMTGAKETGKVTLPGFVDGSRKYSVMVVPMKLESGGSLLGTHFYELTVNAPAFLPGTY